MQRKRNYMYLGVFLLFCFLCIRLFTLTSSHDDSARLEMSDTSKRFELDALVSSRLDQDRSSPSVLAIQHFEFPDWDIRFDPKVTPLENMYTMIELLKAHHVCETDWRDVSFLIADMRAQTKMYANSKDPIIRKFIRLQDDMVDCLVDLTQDYDELRIMRLQKAFNTYKDYYEKTYGDIYL